jgi:maltoporin
MKLFRLTIFLISFLISLSCQATDEINFGKHNVGLTGSFRLGIGTHLGKGNKRSCFKLSGARSKYRLGNECENEVRFGIYDKFMLGKETDPYILVKILPKFKGEEQRKFKYEKFEDAFIEVANLNLIGKENKIWFGRRDISDKVIEINDFALIDIAGTGAGFSDLDFSFGKLSYTYLISDKGRVNHHDEAISKVSQTNHDIRFTGINSNKGGQVSLWVNLAHINKPRTLNSYPLKNGYSIGIFHDQKLWEKSLNTASLQYGNELMGDLNGQGSKETISDAEFHKHANIVRLTNSNIIELNKNWALSTVVISESIYFPKKDHFSKNWTSLGIRPVYYIDDNWRLAFEAGFDHFTTKSNKANEKHYKGHLTKLTLAVEYALSKEFKAPTLLRGFITNANWNKGALIEIRKDVFSTARKGQTIGLQLVHSW